MPANPLTRLINRRSTLPPDVVAAVATLERLREQQPELAPLAGMNIALLQTMYSRDTPALAFAMTPEHAATKREAGLPLLRGETLSLDARTLSEQFIRLCETMITHGNQGAMSLRDATRRTHLDIHDLTMDIIAGEPHAVVEHADRLDLDAGLAATLLRLTLFPMLTRVQQEHTALLDTHTWRRGYCPFCGSWPLLGEYRGLETVRFLRCGLCASEWEIDRFVCPICDNRMHQDLINLVVEGEEAKQRAVACERCRCYVKQISTLVPIPAPQLLAADLATLHLDLAAMERAYAPPQ